MGPGFALTLIFLLNLGLTVAEPLTTEGVVRLFAAGESPERIVAIVERSETDFDLSPAMLQGMRAAGIPESVIRAMRLRQQRAAPLISEPEDGPADGGTLATLSLEPMTLEVRRWIPEQIAIAWDLPNTEEDREVTDLAIYVACLTPEHVPNQWRGHTPLGRDFQTMPRHRLIGFHSAGDDRRTRRLLVDVPETLDLVLPDEAPHDLAIGIAAHAGGAFRRITDDVWHGVTAESIEAGLRASARGKSIESLRVRFLDKPRERPRIKAGVSSTLEIKRSRAP